jgi:flagellar biosynthesis protein FliQ
MVAALVVAGPWMMATLTDYFQRTLTSIPHIVG